MNRWTAPPSRREFSLVLFALTVFAIAYNFENSIQMLGFSNVATSFPGRGPLKVPIGKDGRRLGWSSDPLEDKIVGSWKWEPGHVAGHRRELGQRKGVGAHGSFWRSRDEQKHYHNTRDTVSMAVRPWNDSLPRTVLVKHIPGHTILDNVIIHAGKVYLVTDTPGQFPAIHDIVSSRGSAEFNDWMTISPADALEMFGDFGAFVNGVSFISAEPDPYHISNTTLFGLWRTYASLDTAISPSGETSLPPPMRFIYPHRRFFIDANPDWNDERRRRRMDVAVHHYTLKTSYPWLDVLYYEDWEDWMLMNAPFVFERLVVADPASYLPAQRRWEGLGPKSESWFEPIRTQLVQWFELKGAVPQPTESGGKRKIVYLDVQEDDTSETRLSDGAHKALLASLGSLSSRTYDVRILSTSDSSTTWKERLFSILDAHVVLSVHGGHIMDAVYMKRSEKSTVVELFPADTFNGEYGGAFKELGFDYRAWQGPQKYTQDTLSPSFRTPDSRQMFDIDAAAVVQNIKDILQ